MCSGGLQGTCRLFKEGKAFTAVREAIIFALDSFVAGGLAACILILLLQTLHSNVTTLLSVACQLLQAITNRGTCFCCWPELQL